MTTYGEGVVRHGVNAILEEQADELIRESLIGVTSMEAKKDILTPWKMKNRLEREVFSADGVPDQAVRQGMYHRAWNSTMPHLNSRDGGSVRGTRFDGARRTSGSGRNGQPDMGIGEALGDMGFD